MFKDHFTEEEYKALLKNKKLYSKLYMRYKKQGDINEPKPQMSDFRKLFTDEEYRLLQENAKLYQRCYYKWKRNEPIELETTTKTKSQRVRKSFDYKNNITDWNELTKKQKRKYYQANHYHSYMNKIF